MARRNDWVAIAEHALEHLLAARTERTAVRWEREYEHAMRAGARQERRDSERAQKVIDDYYYDDPYGYEYYEVEVAFDY